MVHLDTNFLIAALDPGSAAQSKLDSWLAAKDPLGISAVAWAEFLCGPLSPTDELTARQIFRSIQDLSQQDAELAARLFTQTGRRSRSLADCMIAAVAIHSGARLATINTPDFQPFTQFGLVLA